MLATCLPICFGAIAFYHTFVQHRKVRRLVRVLCDTPTSHIGDVEPGLREVTGKLLAADEELRSPLQGIPCIYYRVEATRYQRSGVNNSGRHEVTAFTEFESCGAILRDKSGSLAIDVLEIEEVQFEVKTWKGGKGASSKEIRRFEKKYGQPVEVRLHEHVLPTGKKYTAIGTVVSDQGHFKLTSGPSGSLLSPKPESVLVSEFQAQRLTHQVLLVLISFVMLSPTGLLMSMETGLYSILTTFVVTVFAWVVLRAMERSASKTAWSKAWPALRTTPPTEKPPRAYKW
jgi:hypothetical protein